MYSEKLKSFENVENLGGKAWQHAATLDLLDKSSFNDCSIHCFHYQQMFELFFKHLLETKTEFRAYPHTLKLNMLLEQLLKQTESRIDASHYFDALNIVTICAEAYRYNFALDCKTYKRSVEILDPLVDELLCI